MDKKIRVELVTQKGNIEEKSPGEVHAQYWDAKERSRRAFKIWGLLWGIALFCVIIPIAHFILVPSFLLAGPIAAYVTYLQTSAILDGRGSCPGCGKPFAVAKMKIKWPLNDICSECHCAVKIYSLEEA